MSQVWINGTLVDKADARVGLFDHGFLYGDAVWEPLRLFHGKPFAAEHRLKILSEAATALGIDIPLSQTELLAAIDTTAKANNRSEGYVRVIVTRGHKHDLDALRALTPGHLRYVGLIGSKAKVKRIFDALREEGATPDMLSRVHAPIGLDIGAITPQEIAVSILAELIAVKHGKIAEPNVAAVTMRWEGALKK